ncbi:MAG: AAA family ATPase [Caldilineaceae bacterium]|nr:AAA family ATPase [Caldilineaceae bacterium]
MTQLLLTCLGDFQVTLAGAPLTAFPTDKVQALLVYLVVEGQEYRRAELAQFLWPGYREESARHSLRQSLHRLRQLLPDAAPGGRPPGGEPWLLLTRQTVQVNPAALVSSDVATFCALLAQVAAHAHPALAHCPPCLASLRQAVDLYGGDFLAGFTVADSAPFEEWRRVTQEQLHLQALDALTQLANAAESAGDDEGALWAAQRQLALEPWLESAHRQVMRLLAQRGQRAAAIAQYHRCRQVLAEELRVAPDAETSALYEQIQRGDPGKVARRQGDKGTAAHLVTPSPPHPITPAPNLPLFITPLVGRAQALAEIEALLQRPGVRLLTLVGPGGMGKTRLAAEVGRERGGAFADGVCFVPLAPVSTATALVGAIATALGVALQGGDARDLLLRTLRQKQLLLILDNFEQLLGAGAEGEPQAVDLVVDLLDAAPGVQILVTSRERLKLRAEQLYPVQALTFPATATLAEAAASAAVRLFVQALQHVQIDFQLTAANLAAVLRICQLVQGMPLGLELAAANASGVPLSAVADAIEGSAEFLTVDWRDVPERQRSMRAVFVWSWQLLSAEEQRILRQSAVFRGGFTYPAAEAVTGATLPLLRRLTDKSLLQWQATLAPSGRDEGRYVMHELLRQFAAEQLRNTPAEATAVAARHSLYYLDFVAGREKGLTRHNARQAADEIQGEINNIRQAWMWAATHQVMGDAQLIAALGRAAYGLWKFYSQRGPRSEREQMLELALQPVATGLSDGPTDPQRHQQRQVTMSKLLALHATSLVVQGKLSDAAEIARQAIALGQAHAGGEGETLGLIARAQAIAHEHRFAEARVLFEEALQLAHHYRSRYATSEVLADAELTAYEYLAILTHDMEGFQSGRVYLEQSLQLCQRLGKELSEQEGHYALALLAYWSGEYETAQQEFEAALALALRLGYQIGEMFALLGLGEMQRLQGNYTAAQAAIEQGLTLARLLNDRFGQINALVGLSHLHCLLGNLAGAAGFVAQLTQILETHELLPENRVLILDGLAFYEHCAGQTQQALAYAERARQVLEDDLRSRVTLGHIQATVQEWDAASATYQIAVAHHMKRGNRAMAAEPQAGLAHIALVQGDLAGAQAQVEAILPVLAEFPYAGFNDPFFIYLTCYQVLAANGDSRAATLLQQGYDLLQQAAAVLDEESRQRFLTAVSVHRDLIAAYAEQQAQHDQPASEEVKG